MALQVVIIEGPDQGHKFPLAPATFIVLGRGRSAQLRLNDPQVSREHCHIGASGDGIVVSDAGSMGGTFVNGRLVKEHRLRLGDMIRVGQTLLRVQLENATGLTTLQPVPTDEKPSLTPGTVPSLPRVTKRSSDGCPAPSGPGLEPEPGPIDPDLATYDGPVPSFAYLPQDRLDELAGQDFWHYRLEQPLARGQSGHVFRATDNRTYRAVAVKVLWPQFAQRPEEVQRIFRAARTMYSMRHPHIVSLLQAGKTGPYLWFAMDLIEGESLTKVIDRNGAAGKLDWRFALQVGMHLGEALQFAHDRHIVHRNISPQHVLVRAADKCTLLGDLVLAKALEGAQAQQIRRPGEVLGDPPYMSPERLVGIELVDQRSDIYSLGAILYALLTGKPPFAGSSVLETIKLVRTATLVPPRRYHLSVPKQFEDVVLNMLAKRPEERYQSAAELLAQLRLLASFQGSAT